jgi:hypothetical protein
MKYLKIFEDYSSDVELVDINIINQIPKGKLHQSLEYFNKLKEDIKQNGIKEPICILYFVKDNTLTLGEGHHRLQIANELNIQRVPIRVIVNWRGDTRWNNYNVAHEIYHPPKKLDTEVYSKRNYYPTNIKPSELGLY